MNKLGIYYLSVSILTILCAIGGIKLIYLALSYATEGELVTLSTIGGVVILALGWVVGMIFEPQKRV